jgi:hypothetical protein
MPQIVSKTAEFRLIVSVGAGTNTNFLTGKFSEARIVRAWA